MASKYCCYCNGTGKVVCKRCNGNGTVTGNVNPRKQYQCSKCGGRGHEDCHMCNGVGYTFDD